jgi:pyrophosphatase PpaX
VLDRFDVIIGLGDVSQPKPHPEAVLKALERMRVPPAEAIMIGDIPADIEAGRAAGAATIGVVSDLHPADILLSAGADAVIERLDQLIDLVGFTAATATDQSSFSTINR